MKNNNDKRSIEKKLSDSGQIQESVSLARTDGSGNKTQIIFAVPNNLTLTGATDLVSNEIISSSKAHRIPAQLLEKNLDQTYIVLVNSIPRDDKGYVDNDRLFKLPVMNSEDLDKYAQTIQAINNIDQVVVFNLLTQKPINYFHRSEIIPDSCGSEKANELINKALDVQADTVTNDSPEITKPAEIHGPEVGLLIDALDNKYSLRLPNLLARAVEVSPDKGIRYIDKNGLHAFQTYPQLLKDAQTVLAGLHSQGIKAGDKVLLQCEDNRDFLTTFWAAILGSMIPVPLSIAPVYSTDNTEVKKLLNVWQMFEKPMIVCSENLVNDFDRLCNETLLSQQYVLPFSSLAMENTSAFENIEVNTKPNDLALLLLTSGSTGLPKAVMHTHQTLVNRSAATSKFNGFNSSDISLNWMPLDHVGGVVMFHLRDVYNCCSQVQVATSWIIEEPLRWLDIIESESATVTWAPNFAYALIVDRSIEVSQRSWDLSAMRFMLNGGEAVVAKTAHHFLKLLKKDSLPQNAMFPAWGMSETASGVCYSHSFLPFNNVSADTGVVEVGSPIPNTSIRIVNDKNTVLAEGIKGSLHIKGASVTPGYYMNPEINQQAFTDDGWFDTGDAGIINNGQLTITARIKDDIIINGVNYLSAEIETVVESISGVKVSFTAACAVRQENGNTDNLAIFFCPVDNHNLNALLLEIQETVSSSIGIRPEFIMVLNESQIPKTNIGKIQRTLLRNKFEQGEFKENIIQSEKLLGYHVVPDWFYTKNWYQKTLLKDGLAEPTLLSKSRYYLIFCDNTGFSDSVCKALKAKEVRFITVSKANEFQCLNDFSYTLNPECESDYFQLMQALQLKEISVECVLHCWSYAPVEAIESIENLFQAQKTGVYSVLNTLKILTQINRSDTPTRFYMVSSDMQQYKNKLNVFNPHSTVMGLLKTVPYEIPWLTTIHIDFQLPQSEAEKDFQVNAMMDELSYPSIDDEIIYRENCRFSWNLESKNLTSEPLSTCPLKQEGIVLITGGLGGIGRQLAGFLASRFKSKLLLIGRTEIPDKSLWPDLLRQGGKLALRIQQYIEIEALEVEFIYSAVDVTDTKQLESVVCSAEQQWGDELNAVFHLAVGGDLESRWQEKEGHNIIDEPISSYEKMFSSKVYASWEIANLVAKRANTFMTSFGSVIGVFGAARYASYAAAHTFMSQLTQFFDRQNPGRYYLCDWAVWDRIGLSLNEPTYALDYYRSIGYSLISVPQGLDSLLASLSHQHAEIIIGLDGGKWPVRQHLAMDDTSLLQPTIGYTLSDPSYDIAASLKDEKLNDKFGHTISCNFMQLDTVPLNEEGAPDIGQLISICSDKSQSHHNMTRREEQVSVYWCEVLGVNYAGHDVSFFQLGGNSLTATQLILRLKQVFDIHLEIRDLFEAATISAMATLIDKRLAECGRNEEADLSSLDNAALEEFESEEMIKNIDQLSDQQVSELLKKMEQGGDLE